MPPLSSSAGPDGRAGRGVPTHYGSASDAIDFERQSSPESQPGRARIRGSSGAECLDHLMRARQAMGANSIGRTHLDQAEELVKQLAHGVE